MKAVSFRPATGADHAPICALVPTPEELFYVYPSGCFPLSPEQLAELARVRSDLTVAEHDGRVVGFANLYNHQPPQRVFIGNVVVDRALRGKGVGRALVEHMIALAVIRHGVREVAISVFTDNTAALLLYATLGFVPYALEERRDPSGRRVGLLHLRLARS